MEIAYPSNISLCELHIVLHNEEPNKMQCDKIVMRIQFELYWEHWTMWQNIENLFLKKSHNELNQHQHQQQCETFNCHLDCIATL